MAAKPGGGGPHAGTAARAWFGGGFSRLHPLLQRLHTEGGVLEGPVDIELGSGLAGWLGRRLAAKMGLPPGSGRCVLRVTIEHRAGQLVWARRFTNPVSGRFRDVVSVFEPQGRHPDGHWRERTGGLNFRLTVDVPEDGGWHWRVLGARIGAVPVPVRLFPQSRAYKRIEDGRYRFHVGFVMPVLGPLLSYSGLLAVVDPRPAEPGTRASTPRPGSPSA